MTDEGFTVSFSYDHDEQRMACVKEGCMADPNYHYIEDGMNGRSVGMCFGHATEAVYTSGRYGRRERKQDRSQA